MTITVRAEIHVLPGQRDEFVAAAKALAEAASQEPGTVRYDWYESDDPAVLVGIEEYTDAEAALAHNQHSEGLLIRAFQSAELRAAHLHGDLGPTLSTWVAEHPFAHAYPPLFHIHR